MPTAVEHPFFEFLKLDIANRGEQRQLDAAFQAIDADFLKLTNPDLSGREFLKIEQKLGADFHKIGEAYMSVGGDFREIARFALKLDEFVIKLTSPPSPAEADVGNPQTDFLKLDSALKISGADIKLFGADFLKIDDSANLAEFTLKWHSAGKEASGLSSDMSANQDAFQALAGDFLKLGGENTESADHKLGAALGVVADDFAKLSGDFLKLNDALGGGGAIGNSAEAALLLGPAGGAFSALNQDFLKLSDDLTALGGPVASLIGDLFQKGFGDPRS